jgi:hypothetical protein
MSFSKTDRTPRRVPRTRVALALLALAAPALACGPFFPATIINRAEALLAAPFIRFTASLARITAPPTADRAVHPAAEQSLPDHTLAAELADLTSAGVAPAIIAQHRTRRLALAELAGPASGRPIPTALAHTDGLPPEFALYHAGAVAFAQNDSALAAELWQRLLAFPPSERPYKSTWAAYMLGRLHQATAPATALAYFRQTRTLARAGFSDTLGLAAASLGWEAKLAFDTDDFSRAAELYLEQLATTDRTAANSLRFLSARLLARGSPAQLAAFAADARLRELPTAALLAWREDDSDLPLGEGATARWLAALERAAVHDAPQAARLALAAYRAAQFPACARWLRLAAPDDPLALWLRAKLALRAGDVPPATAYLSRLVRRSAQAADPLADCGVSDNPSDTPIPAATHLRGELAALKLASRDYAEALALLLAGGFWADAAYVAERVLTVDELKHFVLSRTAATDLAPSAPKPANASARADDYHWPPPADLRHLLARRLVRHHRLAEARAFFPAAQLPVFDRYATLLRVGRDSTHPAGTRAAALLAAARALRTAGMELRGTELGPDFSIWAGAYTGGSLLADRAHLPAALRPSRDEFWRASAQDAGLGQRFHYRYLAADLAWEALALMPDESDATARALVEAGGWLKNRDPRAAHRFYRALVQRCGSTTLGRAAATTRWFPADSL